MWKRRGNGGLVVALIDSDNVDGVLRDSKKKLDFYKLMKEFLKLGKIHFVFLFIPFGSYHSLPRVNNLGYEIVVCQKMDTKTKEPEKREDKVDSRMAMVGRNFLDCQEVGTIVLLTHDKHSLELAGEVLKKGKRLIYFADRESVSTSPELKAFWDGYEIEVYPLPSKNREGIV